MVAFRADLTQAEGTMMTEIVACLTDGRNLLAEDIQPAGPKGLLGTGQPAVCLEQVSLGHFDRAPADLIVPVSSLLFYYRREVEQEGNKDNE